MLAEKERLDDLEYNGLRIIQHPDGYCFTSDSVLLVNLAHVKKGSRVCDLCTGSGVVAVLCAGKYQPEEVVGVELQERLADMAKRSVLYNHLENVVKILHAPVQGIEREIGFGTFDTVLVNPPYAPCEKKEGYSEEEICKSEAFLTLPELLETSAKILKFGGTFFMVHKAYRLCDVLCLMRQYGIEPKKITLIQPKASKDVDTFVVEGKKGGKPYMTVPAPVVVYEEDGSYSETGRRIYGK